MKRSIGPLPLTDGLFLRAPEGRPGALLRALNVERRDGMVRTRQGSNLVAHAFLGISDVINTDFMLNGVPTGGVPVGANEVYWCLLAAGSRDPIADELLLLSTSSAGDNTADGTITWQYLASDGTWKTLEVVDVINFLVQVRTRIYPVAARQECIHFVVPEDWVAQTVNATLGNGWNIRALLSAPMAGTIVSTTNTMQFFRENMRPKLYSTHHRAGDETYMIAQRASTEIDIYRLSVTSGAEKYLTASAFSISGSSLADICYVPATNEVLLTDGVEVLVMNAATGAISYFTPATVDSDPAAQPAYQDLPLESALDGFTSIIVFAQRVFLGGFVANPLKIQWSAPGDAWHAFPSDNQDILGDGASGRFRKYAVFADTLFIFTTRGIWIATMQEGEGLSEGLLFIKPLEATGCPSADGVVACDKGIFFMADDGPRLITGRAVSKPLSPQIQDLFRPDSTHPHACTRKATACAAWNPVEQRVLFAYASPGAQHNDTVLVLDMRENTAWLWGADIVTDLNQRTSMTTPGVGATVQRKRGLRIASMDWDPQAQKVIAVSPDGLVFHVDGNDDMGIKIPWFLESEILRLPAGEQCIIERIEALCAREHFSNIAVSVIPDGDLSRVDTLTTTIEPDRIDTTAALGQADLAGEGLAPLIDSFGPLRWRGRLRARNFRVQVASVTPDHAPATVVSLTADVTVERGKR